MRKHLFIYLVSQQDLHNSNINSNINVNVYNPERAKYNIVIHYQTDNKQEIKENDYILKMANDRHINENINECTIRKIIDISKREERAQKRN